MDQEGNSEEAEGTATLDARVEGALAQCLHVLYGVELPHRDPDWGSMEVSHPNMRCPRPCLPCDIAPISLASGHLNQSIRV